jgi:hypothetical protein
LSEQPTEIHLTTPGPIPLFGKDSFTKTLGEDSEPKYLPCAAWILFLAMLGVGPDPEPYRYLVSAARRCDSARRQFLRVREILAEINPEGSRDQDDVLPTLAAIGDTEMAVTALYRALDMADQARGLFRVQLKLPPALRGKKRALLRLRDAYEHIDQRARGLARDTTDPSEILSVFDFSDLLDEDAITYAGERFDINTETTGILVVLRDFIVDEWIELCILSGRATRPT